MKAEAIALEGQLTYQNQESSMLVRRDVRGVQIGDTLQLDRRLPTVNADIRIAAMRADVVMLLQIRERVALDIQLILAGDEVVDDVLTASLARQELE